MRKAKKHFVGRITDLEGGEISVDFLRIHNSSNRNLEFTYPDVSDKSLVDFEQVNTRK